MKTSDGDRTDLVPVHGGLSSPVDRVIPLRERKGLLAESIDMPSVTTVAHEGGYLARSQHDLERLYNLICFKNL